VRQRRGKTIVTPEHVEIHLEPAGLGRRFIALVVDLVLVTAVASFAVSLGRAWLPGALGTLAVALALLILSWGYHVYFEVRHQGRSPGKRVAGIRVVDDRGLPLSVEQAFVRNAVRVLDALPFGYGLGAAACLLDRHSRRLGDLAAGTLVVRESVPVSYERRSGPARSFNSLRTPRLVRLARQRISLDERELLAELCLRADGLEPGPRFELMEDVGRHFRERLGIDAPHLSGEAVVRGLAALLLG
jgi:uncharacterized RDD family membrane protein YckC